MDFRKLKALKMFFRPRLFHSNNPWTSGWWIREGAWSSLSRRKNAMQWWISTARQVCNYFRSSPKKTKFLHLLYEFQRILWSVRSRHLNVMSEVAQQPSRSFDCQFLTYVRPLFCPRNLPGRRQEVRTAERGAFHGPQRFDQQSALGRASPPDLVQVWDG